MTTIVWEEPPPRAGQSVTWAQIAAELRAHPGQWAKVRTYSSTRGASNIASGLRRGRLAIHEMRADEFEVEPRGRDVYARFTGPSAGAS